ncbi:MAG: beta-ketoacyl-[acyl-carrier-protein] synthase family protein [Desulfosarcinaceae bacterium]
MIPRLLPPALPPGAPPSPGSRPIRDSAAADSLRYARLPQRLRDVAGLCVGGGPNLDLGGEIPDIRAGRLGEEKLAALWMLRFLPNTAASTMAQLLGLHGENLTVGTACTASLQAIGEAFRKIRDDHITLALAGGGDSRLSPGALLAYDKAQALYSGDLDPDRASRPFDSARQGFVPGEGAAFFLLEEAAQALARRAPILGEILGYGATLDGHTMTAPEPEGRWAEQAVRQAIAQAGLTPEQIEAVSAHGTGTALNDTMEAGLLARLYGSRRPPVVAFKSWIGHLAAACGAVELALVLSAWASGSLPPIRNLDAPCHPDLNFVRHAAPAPQGAMVLQNFGFGGQNAALVVRRAETLDGLFRLEARAGSRSLRAFIYRTRAVGPAGLDIEAEMMFGIVDYGKDFQEQHLRHHYQELFTCLCNATAAS